MTVRSVTHSRIVCKDKIINFSMPRPDFSQIYSNYFQIPEDVPKMVLPCQSRHLSENNTVPSGGTFSDFCCKSGYFMVLILKAAEYAVSFCNSGEICRFELEALMAEDKNRKPRSEYPGGRYPCELNGGRAKQPSVIKTRKKNDARVETLKESFLKALAETGAIADACRKVGIAAESGTITIWRGADAKFNTAVMEIREEFGEEDVVARKAMFLEIFEKAGSIVVAAKKVGGITSTTVRKWAKEDEKFKEAMSAILDDAIDEVRGAWLEIVRREPPKTTNRDVIQAGEKIAKLQGEMIDKSEIKQEITQKGGMAELANALAEKEREEKEQNATHLNVLKADRQ